MTYNEPPLWHQPVRHLLGALLLRAGRAAEAVAVYQEDLRRFPENGWSLLGLTQAYRALGRREEAGQAERRFLAAWREADVRLPASRF
jgi:tetratricopeptide (TPR) repeat protein